jgi:hypothetical protein
MEFMRRIDGGFTMALHAKSLGERAPKARHTAAHRVHLNAPLPSNASWELKCKRILQEVFNWLCYGRASFWRLLTWWSP